MRRLRQRRVVIGFALLATLLALLVPAITQWRAATQEDPFAVYCTTLAADGMGSNDARPVQPVAEGDHADHVHPAHPTARATPLREASQQSTAVNRP